MSTTYSTDDDVHMRAPLVGKALARVNAMRADSSLSVTTLDAYRVEAQAQILLDLQARGIESSRIVNTAALRVPEAYLAAALLFEAASVRDDKGSVVNGQLDVFAAQARVTRAAYAREISTARPLGTDALGQGSSFSWERG